MKLAGATVLAAMLLTLSVQAVDVIKVPERPVQPPNIPMGTQALEPPESADRDRVPANSMPASANTPPADAKPDPEKHDSDRPPVPPSR